jgi:DNA-directed RNA polymerase subunit RPC12/RpoP
MARTYIIYCEPCGYKKVIDDLDNIGLTDVKTSTVQGRIPVLDKETKKTKTFSHITTIPKYKCPRCGRAVTLRKYNVPKSPEVKLDTDETQQDQIE